MHSRGLLGAAAVLSLASSVAAGGDIMGFNYGNKKPDDSIKVKNDYLADFKQAQELAGTQGKFNSARIYTMIQGGTDDDYNQAIDAAVESNTSLLLGMWASAGGDSFKKECSALKKAIDKYGDKFAKLVVGLSVGSEDLYRISEIGIKNKSPVGAGPDIIVDYIKQARDIIKGTPLAQVPVGHVDTADVWANGTNAPVIDAIDFLGFDEYPYFENTRENSIENAANLWWNQYDKTEKVAKGKPIWVTETGWPTSGKTENLAIPSADNAEKFYNAVGCRILGKMNVWWYILEDDGASPSFGVAQKGSTKPYHNLDCSKVKVDYSRGPGGNGTTGGNSTSSDDSGSGSGSSNSTSSYGSSNSTGGGSGGSQGSTGSNGGASGSSGSASPGSLSGKPQAGAQGSSASIAQSVGFSALMALTGAVAFLL